MRFLPAFMLLLLLACSTETNTEQANDAAPTEEAATEPETNEPASSAAPTEATTPVNTSGYNEELAYELGADEYGMRQYVFAYLKRGPNRDMEPEEAEALQRAHLDNITRLAEEGKLVLAGPFMDDGDVRGIYVFAVESLEEAERIAFSDPAIEAGSLEMELHPWYGSAALMMLNDWHSRISKEGI